MPPLAQAEAVQPLAPDAPGDGDWTEGFNFPGINNPIGALAFGQDGSLYAGGMFSTADGKPSSKIARWTGEAPMTPVLWFPLVRIHQ